MGQGGAERVADHVPNVYSALSLIPTPLKKKKIKRLNTKPKTPNVHREYVKSRRNPRTGGYISIDFLVKLLHYPWISKMGVMGNI